MKSFIEFVKKYKIPFIFLFLIMFVIYAYYIQNIVSIDTEHYINDPKGLLQGWISLDRWGLVLIKNVVIGLPFHIVLVRILTVLLFLAATLLYTYLFTKWSRIENQWILFLTSLAIATSPIFAEQFGFTLQSAEIALGLLLLAIDFIFIEKYLTKHKQSNFFTSILLTTFCFGLYQSFVLLFISVCIFYILTHDHKNIGKFLLIFFISFGLNSIIIYILKNYIYQVNTSYLTNNFKWKTDGILKCILRIGYFGVTTLLGRAYYHSIVFTFFVIIGVIYLLKSKKLKQLFFFGSLAISPFLLIIATASNTAYRAQFSYVFVLVFLFLYLYQMMNQKKMLSILLIIFIAKSILITPALFYSDSIRYQNDLKLANDVKEIMKENPNQSIIFVGIYNSSTKFKGETLGNSFATWDYETEMGVNTRMFGFLNAHDIYPQFPTKEQYIEAMSNENHGYYPDQDGIIYRDDAIVIYLR